MLLLPEQWPAFFRDFKRSAFRLEVHQAYTMPAEAGSVRAFLAGEPKPEGFNSDWHEIVSEQVRLGRTMTRAKLVAQPFTAYTRYLFEWAIPGNVEAGENYLIADISESSFGLPKQDFWLFDESTVVHLNYRSDGTQISRELIENPDLDWYFGWRNIAIENAVPFREYRA